MDKIYAHFVFLRGDLRPRLDYYANPALNLAPFGRWTLRDKAAQRRLALRWAFVFLRLALNNANDNRRLSRHFPPSQHRCGSGRIRHSVDGVGAFRGSLLLAWAVPWLL